MLSPVNTTSSTRCCICTKRDVTGSTSPGKEAPHPAQGSGTSSSPQEGTPDNPQQGMILVQRLTQDPCAPGAQPTQQTSYDTPYQAGRLTLAALSGDTVSFTAASGRVRPVQLHHRAVQLNRRVGWGERWPHYARRNPAADGKENARGSLLRCACASAVAACSSSPPRAASSPTPTHSPAVTPTATLPAGVTRLSFIGNDEFYPSPDGALIAVVDSSLTSITLYDLQGTMHGVYTASSGHVLASWLPDSSGLFVADGSVESCQAPLLFIESTASHTPRASTVVRPSMRGEWSLCLVGRPVDRQDHSVRRWRPGPRSFKGGTGAAYWGGAKRVLPAGSDQARVLGWLPGRLVYYDSTQNAMSPVAPPDGAPQFITHGFPPEAQGGGLLYDQLYPDAGPSPDGQALSLQGDGTGSGGGLWELVGTQLQRPPKPVQAGLILWVGAGHDVLGAHDGQFEALDIITSAVERATPTSLGEFEIEALSGDWAFVLVLDGSEHGRLAVANDQTGFAQDFDAGSPPAFYPVFPLGQTGA